MAYNDSTMALPKGWCGHGMSSSWSEVGFVEGVAAKAARVQACIRSRRPTSAAMAELRWHMPGRSWQSNLKKKPNAVAQILGASWSIIT